MAPKKRTTRSSPATTSPTTTPVTDKQLRTLISQGVTNVLANMMPPESEIAKTALNSYVRIVGHDVAYAMTWTDLKKMTDKMFLKESDKIERYVGGLFDMIHESLMASKPKIMQDAIEFATELMDKKIITLAERQAENKRKLDNNNQTQQQPPKKQGVAIAYTIGPGERKEYAGTLPLCNNCKFHTMASAL
nr:hypothetical protein [Tanacetum cinerariifolium]